MRPVVSKCSTRPGELGWLDIQNGRGIDPLATGVCSENHCCGCPSNAESACVAAVSVVCSFVIWICELRAFACHSTRIALYKISSGPHHIRNSFNTVRPVAKNSRAPSGVSSTYGHGVNAWWRWNKLAVNTANPRNGAVTIQSDRDKTSAMIVLIAFACSKHVLTLFLRKSVGGSHDRNGGSSPCGSADIFGPRTENRCRVHAIVWYTTCMNTKLGACEALTWSAKFDEEYLSQYGKPSIHSCNSELNFAKADFCVQGGLTSYNRPLLSIYFVTRPHNATIRTRYASEPILWVFGWRVEASEDNWGGMRHSVFIGMPNMKECSAVGSWT